jgi:hypothetical protein
MNEEQAALFRLARSHGDAGAAGRLEAGRTLMAERFGASPAPLGPGALGDLVVRENGRVRHVIVGGRVAVRDGQLAGGDINAITAAAEDAAARLWARMRGL